LARAERERERVEAAAAVVVVAVVVVVVVVAVVVFLSEAHVPNRAHAHPSPQTHTRAHRDYASPPLVLIECVLLTLRSCCCFGLSTPRDARGPPALKEKRAARGRAFRPARDLREKGGGGNTESRLLCLRWGSG